MNKYELVVIIDASLSQEAKETIIKNSGDAIAKHKGKVINSQIWLDKQRFSFRMKKKIEGTYYLINFESPASSIAALRRSLKLNEKVIRSLIIKTE